MTNPYFTPSGYPATRASGSSSSMRAELSSIAAAFDKLPTLSGMANRVVQVNAAETGLEAVNSITLTAISLATGGILPGSYTPSATNDTNVAASTPGVFYHFRLGNFCFAIGTAAIDPTAATTITRLELSLPIASNISSSVQLSGGMVRNLTDRTYLSGEVFGNAVDKRATLQFYNDGDTGNRTWRIWFGYPIL